jgi:4-amino-4-deoxy-L-arabinose transferase-like glycosyltransferase
MFSRSRLLLLAIVLVAAGFRIAFLVADPHPFADSGLAADSAEVARQIDQHARWFESNLTALNQLGTVQDGEQRLLDPSSLDFRAADAHPQYQEEALQPPGEAIILAGLWKLTGSERWLPYQLLTIVVDSLMTLVVFYIGSMLFRRRRAAFIGALLYAVFPPIAWLTTIPHLDFWAVDFTLVIVALLLRARASARPAPSLIAAGVAIGLGSYFRPGLLLLAPLVAVAMLSRTRWRQALATAAVPTAVAVLLLVPWTIRNYDVFHRFVAVRIGSGQALWEGMGELPNTFGAKLDDGATFAQVHAVRPGLVYGSPAYDSFLLSWGTRAIREHPEFYARLVGDRLLNSTVRLHNTDWTNSSPAPSLASALEPLLFVISLLTVLATRRRFGRSHAILAAVIVATILPYLFLHFEPRYVLPASFAYLLLTALAIDLVAEPLLGRLSRRGGRASAAREETDLALR